jgi:hypothetical protein
MSLDIGYMKEENGLYGQGLARPDSLFGRNSHAGQHLNLQTTPPDVFDFTVHIVEQDTLVLVGVDTNRVIYRNDDSPALRSNSRCSQNGFASARRMRSLYVRPDCRRCPDLSSTSY